MYVDEPPKDGNIPDFNISKIDICPFRAYQRSFRLFQGDFSKDIHQRSRLLCFTQNDHTGQTGFKICPFLKWAQRYISLSRRNSMFFGSHEGAGRAAILYSIAISCRLNGINLFEYICDVIEKTAEWQPNTPLEKYRDLLPDRWKKQ